MKSTSVRQVCRQARDCASLLRDALLVAEEGERLAWWRRGRAGEEACTENHEQRIMYLWSVQHISGLTAKYGKLV